MNAGTVDGSTTIPGTSALVIYTGGDWNSGTDIYTAPVGADMTESQVGRFASLYVDGDTAPTTNQYLVARITAVNSGTRQITLSTTARTLLGTEVSTGTGTRSLRIGGAWAGMSGTSGFPMNYVTDALTNSAGDLPQVNYCSDLTMSITANISTVNANTNHQGYTTSYFDMGLANLVGPTTGASFILIGTTVGANSLLIDFDCRQNGATGSSTGVFWNSNGGGLVRCVLRAFRGAAYASNGTGNRLVESELHGNNTSNSATGVILINGSDFDMVRCIVSDNTGTATNGLTGGGTYSVQDTVFAGCGASGILATSGSYLNVNRCDFYANTLDGINLNSGSNSITGIQNSNFTHNGRYGINNSGGAKYSGYIWNCGFGTGTAANTSGNFNNVGMMAQYGNVNYASSVTPWVNPANGDFRITLAAAKGAGRGTYRQTQSGKSGMVAYPDIGAGQHQDSGGGGGAYVIGG